jgi:hypothetical protein
MDADRDRRAWVGCLAAIAGARRNALRVKIARDAATKTCTSP